MGRDFTIYSLAEGYVKFETKGAGRKYVSVVPVEKAE